MTESVQKSELKPWIPSMGPDGTVYIPLSSGEWDIILEPDGSLMLACKVPNQDGSFRPYVMYLADCEHDPKELLEGINMLRNQALSCSGPN